MKISYLRLVVIQEISYLCEEFVCKYLIDNMARILQSIFFASIIKQNLFSFYEVN